MKHYFCRGECGGVSDTAKNCGALECSRFDKPLTECECMDGKHGIKDDQPPSGNNLQEENDPSIKSE